MRGMFRKHQDGAERAFHGALRPCMSSCCQQEGHEGFASPIRLPLNVAVGPGDWRA